MDELYSIQEAARRIQIGVASLHRWVHIGRIPTDMVVIEHGKWYFKKKKFDKFAKTEDARKRNTNVEPETPKELVRFMNLELSPNVMERYLRFRRKKILNEKRQRKNTNATDTDQVKRTIRRRISIDFR